MEFDNNRWTHKALGGQPPPVVYSLQIEALHPDQQEQIRA
jgi:putative transposase